MTLEKKSKKAAPAAIAARLSHITGELKGMSGMLAQHIQQNERRIEALLDAVKAAKDSADFDASQFRSAIWALQADIRRTLGDIELEYALRDDGAKSSAEALARVRP